MAQDQVAPIYEEIYQDMVKLMDANTEHGDKLEKILTMVELITLIAIIAVIALAILQPAGSAECLHRILLILWISWVLVLIHLQRGISPVSSRR